MDHICTEQPGLLWLTGKAEHRLLLYLGASEGGGGVQGLLSLRLVCRTTKGWVDNLSPRFGQRVFSRVVVRVDLSKMGVVDYLKSFLESPPPSPITSLYLCGVNKMDLILHTSSSLEMWKRFTNYWATKLKSIELDKFSFERHCLIRKLLVSKEIQYFHCENLLVSPDLVRGPSELPFNFKSLRIDRLDIDDEGRRERRERLQRQDGTAFNTLFQNKSLTEIDVSVYNPSNLETISCLLRARRFLDEDNLLKLTLRVYPYYVRELDPIIHRESVSTSCLTFGEVGGSTIFSILPWSPGDYVEFETFLEAVAECKSQIEIVGFNAHDISRVIKIIKSTVSNDEGNQPNHRRQYKFFKLRNTPQTLIIKLFPTTMNEELIGQIGTNGNASSQSASVYRKGFLLRAAQLDHLTSLCISLNYTSDFNEKLNAIASESVTNLSIKLLMPHGSCFFAKILVEVALKFPRVEKLEIFWDYGSNQSNINTREHLLYQYKEFTDLKTFILNIRSIVDNENEVVNDIRDVLLHIISQLSLQSLNVQVYKRPVDDDWFRIPLVDEVFLSSFLERPIGSTLCYFRVSDNLFVSSAREHAKAVILSVTGVNKRKLENSESAPHVMQFE